MGELIVPGLIILAIIVAIVALMAVGWNNRGRRQSGLGPLPQPPAELGDVVHTEDALYLATTRAEAPLDRIAVRGLGFRAPARVSVTATGILLELVGETPFFIEKSRLSGVGVATWTVDRVVERDGLVFLRWVLGETALDSYLRSDDPPRLLAALEPLAPTPADGSAPADSAPADNAPNESDNT